jgi:hypothetical protein
MSRGVSDTYQLVRRYAQADTQAGGGGEKRHGEISLRGIPYPTPSRLQTVNSIILQAAAPPVSRVR